MQNFITLKEVFDDRPWLLLGKGPTFSKVTDIPLNQYHMLGLNEVAEHIEVDITVIIDLEPLSNRIINNSTYLFVPFYPHCNCKVSNKNIYDWLYRLNKPYHIKDMLARALSCEKLYFYNLSTWKGNKELPLEALVTAKYFSAEAAFDIITYLGANEIYSLGIDGGTEYAEEFKHLTPLTNHRKSFDDQFKEIKRKIKEKKIKYQSL